MMRLRKPDCSPPSWKAPEQLKHTHKLKVELITPMYGGGVDAGIVDKDMPIRASSIRGQLRFWWRLLNRQRFGGDYTALFEAEREIWGGLGDSPDDLRASQVQVRVQSLSQVKIDLLSNIKPAPPNYALAVMLTGTDEKPSLLCSGCEFTLTITLASSKQTADETKRDELWKIVEETLRWWASFGGVGARTRRGLGAVYIKNLNPVTPEEAKAKGCRLVIQTNKHNDAMSAWEASIKKLAAFRQGEGIGRREKQTGNNTPGRSFWPEPDAIRRLTGIHRVKAGGIALEPVHPAGNVFPRAFFGMPILFHFKNIKKDNLQRGERKDERLDPADSTLMPKGYERMASPLIIRPYVISQNQFAGCALKLPVDHLKLDLELKAGSRLFPLPAQQWWPGTPTISNSIAPMRNRGNDPLDAFLSFFQEN